MLEKEQKLSISCVLFKTLTVFAKFKLQNEINEIQNSKCALDRKARENCHEFTYKLLLLISHLINAIFCKETKV